MERSRAWSRSGFLQAAGSAALTGVAACGGGGGSGAGVGGGVPVTPSTAPSGPSQTASVVVSRPSAGTQPAIVSPGFVGLSYEKSKLSSGFFNAGNATLIGCFQRLGASVLRIGGNSVDQTTWAPNGVGSTAVQVAPADILGLAAFVKSAGWRVIYGINLGTNTPAVAAAEAAVAAQALGSTLLGFEIGNECDLYHSNGLRPTTYSVTDFEAEWSTYAAAIRTSVPNAPITGPASAGSVGTWTAPFAGAEATSISLLTQHYYRANGQLPTSTIPYLLAGDPNLPTMLAQLKTAAANVSGGYRIGEANSFYNGGAPNVSDAYGTALWAIDFLLINALNGSTGVNFHGGGNGTGYTPIADASGAVVEVRPVYYGMLFVAQLPLGTMYGTTVTTTLQLTAYAVVASSGVTSLVIVNKDATNTAVTTIALPATASRAIPLALTGTDLNATTGTLLGGAAVGNTGAWTPLPSAPLVFNGSSLTVNVPPASAVMLSIS